MPATASITPPPRRSPRCREIVELNIGHFLVGEAVFAGLAEAVKRMRAAMDRGRAAAAVARMIIGLGSDIIDVRRIEQGDRAARRALPRRASSPPIERAKAERRARPRRDLCQAFAAKEACAKALGTGFRARRVLARHGRGQPAVGPADHAADRRRADAAAGASRRRAARRASTSRITDEGPTGAGHRGHSSACRAGCRGSGRMNIRESRQVA